LQAIQVWHNLGNSNRSQLRCVQYATHRC
jgi:hypothetical protein